MQKGSVGPWPTGQPRSGPPSPRLSPPRHPAMVSVLLGWNLKPQAETIWARWAESRREQCTRGPVRLTVHFTVIINVLGILVWPH